MASWIIVINDSGGGLEPVLCQATTCPKADLSLSPEIGLRMLNFLYFRHLWLRESEHRAGLILGLHPANERRRYFVTTYLIGWVQA